MRSSASSASTEDGEQVDATGTTRPRKARAPLRRRRPRRRWSGPRRAVRPGCRSEDAFGPAIATSASSTRRHPRHCGAVVEPDHELRRNLDLAANALDDPGEDGVVGARRHEVDHAHRAVVELERRLEDERVGPVPAADPRAVVRRREQPASVLRSAEQRGEARARVEPGEAEPVDRARRGETSAAVCRSPISP